MSILNRPPLVQPLPAESVKDFILKMEWLTAQLTREKSILPSNVSKSPLVRVSFIVLLLLITWCTLEHILPSSTISVTAEDNITTLTHFADGRSCKICWSSLSMKMPFELCNVGHKSSINIFCSVILVTLLSTKMFTKDIGSGLIPNRQFSGIQLKNKVVDGGTVMSSILKVLDRGSRGGGQLIRLEDRLPAPYIWVHNPQEDATLELNFFCKFSGRCFGALYSFGGGPKSGDICPSSMSCSGEADRGRAPT